METADFDVRLEVLPGGAAVVHVRGDLDLGTAPALAEAIASAGDPENVVLDLGECSFVDSAALRTILVAARATQDRGGRLALVVTDPGIRRVLEITAVDTMLPVHSTIDSAL